MILKLQALALLALVPIIVEAMRLPGDHSWDDMIRELQGEGTHPPAAHSSSSSNSAHPSHVVSPALSQEITSGVSHQLDTPLIPHRPGPQPLVGGPSQPLKRQRSRLSEGSFSVHQPDLEGPSMRPPPHPHLAPGMPYTPTPAAIPSHLPPEKKRKLQYVLDRMAMDPQFHLAMKGEMVKAARGESLSQRPVRLPKVPQDGQRIQVRPEKSAAQGRHAPPQVPRPGSHGLLSNGQRAPASLVHVMAQQPPPRPLAAVVPDRPLLNPGASSSRAPPPLHLRQAPLRWPQLGQQPMLQHPQAGPPRPVSSAPSFHHPPPSPTSPSADHWTLDEIERLLAESPKHGRQSP